MSEGSIWNKGGLAAIIHFVSSYLLFNTITALRSPLLPQSVATGIWTVTLVILIYSFVRAYRDPEVKGLYYAKVSGIASLVTGSVYLGAVDYLSLGKIHMDISGALLVSGISILLAIPLIYRFKSMKIEGIRGIPQRKFEKLKNERDSDPLTDELRYQKST